MEPLFDVCFAGELLENQDMHAVRQGLQKLFNASPETLDKLFSGKMQVLKRGCDEATALKYRQAMAKAGALAVMRPLAKAEEKTAPEPAASPESGLVLAPPQSDVLRPEERAAPISNDIDTSSLDIAEVGATLGTPNAETAQAPDTSHLSVAEVGEDIPNLPSSEHTIDPDISNIHLSPEGSDFSDCSPPAPTAPAVDVSDMDLAPAGSEVLEEQYKKAETATQADTSHIALE